MTTSPPWEVLGVTQEKWEETLIRLKKEIEHEEKKAEKKKLRELRSMDSPVDRVLEWALWLLLIVDCIVLLVVFAW